MSTCDTGNELTKLKHTKHMFLEDCTVHSQTHDNKVKPRSFSWNINLASEQFYNKEKKIKTFIHEKKKMKQAHHA